MSRRRAPWMPQVKTLKQQRLECLAGALDELRVAVRLLTTELPANDTWDERADLRNGARQQVEQAQAKIKYVLEALNG